MVSGGCPTIAGSLAIGTPRAFSTWVTASVSPVLATSLALRSRAPSRTSWMATCRPVLRALSVTLRSSDSSSSSTTTTPAAAMASASANTATAVVRIRTPVAAITLPSFINAA